MSPMRLCPGKGTKPCGSFMSGVERDPHPLCARCRGQECHRQLTCEVCVSWSEAQWKEFAKKKKRKSKSQGSVVSAGSIAPQAPSTEPSEIIVDADPYGGLTADEFWRAERFAAAAAAGASAQEVASGTGDGAAPSGAVPVTATGGDLQGSVPPLEPVPAGPASVSRSPPSKRPRHRSRTRSSSSSSVSSSDDSEESERRRRRRRRHRERSRSRSRSPRSRSGRRHGRHSHGSGHGSGDRDRRRRRRDRSRSRRSPSSRWSRTRSRSHLERGRDSLFAGFWGVPGSSGFIPPSSYFRFLAGEREKEERNELLRARTHSVSKTPSQAPDVDVSAPVPVSPSVSVGGAPPQRPSGPLRDASVAGSVGGASSGAGTSGVGDGSEVHPPRSHHSQEGARGCSRCRHVHSPIRTPLPVVSVSASCQTGVSVRYVDASTSTEDLDWLPLSSEKGVNTDPPPPPPAVRSVRVQVEMRDEVPLRPTTSGGGAAGLESPSGSSVDGPDGDDGEVPLVGEDTFSVPVDEIHPPDSGQEDEVSFREVISFIREFHAWGQPKGVQSKAHKSAGLRVFSAVREPAPSLQLPLSELGVDSRERINSALRGMVRDSSLSLLPFPRVREYRFYRPEDDMFPAPFDVSCLVTSLTFMSRSEMNRISASIPHSLLSAMESSSSALCEVSSWLDSWVSSLHHFVDALPVEQRALFCRVCVSGSRGIVAVARAAMSLCSNLMLVHRDSVMEKMSSLVPREHFIQLRNAPLPTSRYLFPTDLVEAALKAKYEASQHTLVYQAITASKIPRVSSKSRVSEGTKAGTSGLPPGAGVSPVVPPGTKQGSSSGPAPNSSGKKKQNKKKSSNFRGAGGRGAPSGGSGKGRGKR